MDGVDGDGAHGIVLPFVLLGRNIPLSHPHREHALELPLRAHRGDVQIRIQDLQFFRDDEILCRYDPFAFGFDLDHIGIALVELKPQLFEVQHDIGHILLDARNVGELVKHSVESHRGYCRTLQ